MAFAVALCVLWHGWPSAVTGATDAAGEPAAGGEDAGVGGGRPAPMYIREYRVKGVTLLPRTEVERAVYPYLGPARTPDDVDGARAALEAAYHAAGYQTVAVEIPQQEVKGGVVQLEAVETTVGRLRVKGARYYLPSRIKEQARSLAEGKVIQFDEVKRDILSLNQLADRRVTPELRPGLEPGTVDVDLKVEDHLPLHGSVELNNRYSPDTSKLRLNASLSYANLWQLGHSIGASFQVAPENPEEVLVYSGYYIARVPGIDNLSFMIQGTKQDSDVSTLGGVAVAGRGETVGARIILTLPARERFYHSLSAGLDYRDVDQVVAVGGEEVGAPVWYYPFNVTYSATWAPPGQVTELNAGATFHLRGMGASAAQFDESRYGADGGFIHLRGDISHERDLPLGFQVFAKVQGQVASGPLINTEQYSGGGLETVRGYLEGEALGDNAVIGTLELRSPSLLSRVGRDGEKGGVGDWRAYAFVDGGILALRDALPEQISRFELASVGVGSRLRIFDHLEGSIDLALPLIGQTYTDAHKPFLLFRVKGDF